MNFTLEILIKTLSFKSLSLKQSRKLYCLYVKNLELIEKT